MRPIGRIWFDSSGSIMVPDESVKVDAVFVCQSASTLPCIWSNIVLFLDQMQVVWIDRNRFVWIDPHLMLHMAPYAALEPISPIAARAANDGDIGPSKWMLYLFANQHPLCLAFGPISFYFWTKCKLCGSIEIDSSGSIHT